MGHGLIDADGRTGQVELEHFTLGRVTDLPVLATLVSNAKQQFSFRPSRPIQAQGYIHRIEINGHRAKLRIILDHPRRQVHLANADAIAGFNGKDKLVAIKVVARNRRRPNQDRLRVETDGLQAERLLRAE